MKIGGLNTKKIKGIFRRRPERLGVELSDHSVRIVRVKKNLDGSFSVASFGELDIDIRNLNAIERQRFQSAIAQLGGGIVRVASNMEHSTLRIRRMNFAKMPDRDILEAIKWNFREHVESDIHDYVVSYAPLPRVVDGNKNGIMAYGVAGLAVKEQVQLFRSLGLKVVSLEPAATALFAAFGANGVLDDRGSHVCVAIGEMTTLFIVMNRDSMLFSRPLAGISHDLLVKHVMRNLNMEELEAKMALALWIEKGNVEDSMAEEPLDSEAEKTTDEKIKMTVGHFWSQFMIELQRSIDAYCIMYGADKIDDINVCGIGAMYPGLLSHTKKTLGVETTIFNPFAKLMDESQKTPETLRRAPLYAVALGLAIPQ